MKSYSEHKLDYMKYLVCFMVMFLGVGNISKVVWGGVPPQTLFTIQKNEALTKMQIKKRWKYTKQLELQFSGDTIIAPTDKRPKVYVEYVRALVDTLNHYVKRLPELEKTMLLKGFLYDDADEAFLKCYLQVRDSMLVLNVSQEDVIYFDMKDKYEKLKSELAVFNMNMDGEDFDTWKAACELPRSTFCDSFFFNRSCLGEYYDEIQHAIFELNRKYGKK